MKQVSLRGMSCALVCATAMVLAMPGANAQSMGGSAAGSTGAGASSTSGGYGASKNWGSAFSGKQVQGDGLETAIRTLESRTGGNVLEARMDPQSGGYDAVVVNAGKVSAVHLASLTGEATAIPASSVPDWGKRYFNEPRLERDLKSAKIGIAAAIDKAISTERGGSPVFAAFTESSTGSIIAYNVAVVGPDGHSDRVVVDAQTGQVIADPGALSGWP